MARRDEGGGPAHDLRRALLDAAAEVVAEVGPGAVSLREIARRCAVSHAAPAHHFGDRSGMLSALAAEGFFALADALRAATGTGGRATLAAQGRAYVAYAASAPGHFPVMFRPELTDDRNADLVEARIAAFAALDAAVTEAQADGWSPGTSHDVAVVTAWATVHGLATLWLDGALPPHLAAAQLDETAAAMTDLLTGVDGAAAGRPRVRRRR